jgi:hypothetical protein
MAQPRWPDLHVAHRAKLIPTGPEQRRHLPPLGDGFGGVAAMPEGVAVTRRRTDTVSTAVHPPSLPPAHDRSGPPVVADRPADHGQLDVRLTTPSSMFWG